YSREFEQEADYLGLRYASEAGYDPRALGSFFKELLADQRINSAGVPAYMLTHPLTEDRVANVATAITSQHLKTPAGRPASGTEFPEAQAVARAIAEPADVVIGRYRRMADEKPEDAERQLLLGRVYQTVGQLEAARAALERCRPPGGLALGRRGDEAEGFYRLAVASRLRGELEQALSHFQRTKPLLDPASPRRQEVDQAIAELLPLVHERERERLERRRGPRRGVALGGLRP